jgi:hypothetical protein
MPDTQTATTDTAAANPAVANPAANGGPVAAAAPQPAAAAAPWYGADIPDPDLKGWLELKKPADAIALAKMARESERMIGVPPDQILRLPKADAKPEEMAAFYDKLGRPKTPDDYKLEVPMGDDGAFAKAIAPILHKWGVTGAQAKGLNEDWNALMGSTQQNTEAQTSQQSQADILNLKREWGNSYDSRLELGRRAIRTFGAELGGTPEEQHAELLKLENYMGGSAKMIKLFAAVGSKLGEANFHDGSAPASFNGMTPDAAKVRKEELMSNPDWAKRYNAGDKAAIAELDALQRIQNSKAA